MALQRVSPGIYRNTATGKTVRSATRPVQQPQRQARQPIAPIGGSLVQPDPAMQQSGFGGPQRQARQPIAPIGGSLVQPDPAMQQSGFGGPQRQARQPIAPIGGSLVQPDLAMQQSGFGGPQPMGPQSPASAAIDQMKGGIPQGDSGAMSQVDDPNAGMSLQDRSAMGQQQQGQGGRCPYCGK